MRFLILEVSMGSIVEGEPERDSSIARFKRSREDHAHPHARRDITGLKSLTYRKESPNGGSRELIIMENGDVHLTVRDPVMDMLEGEKEFSVSSTLSELGRELEHHPVLEAYNSEEGYDELDELIDSMESQLVPDYR